MRARPITTTNKDKIMNVIVTGATGFVGREIVCELERKKFRIYRVGNSNVNQLISNSASDIFKIDITNFEEVKKLRKLKDIDAIIHSAGLAHQFGSVKREEFQKVNVGGTGNILELAINLKVKHFILISSTAIYGTEKKTENAVKVIDENSVCRPQTLYAESKLDAEKLAKEVCERNDIDLTIFRLAPVLGEGNEGNAARMVEAIDRKRFVWIGSGQNYKSLIYKNDVAGACVKILENKKKGSEIFNLAAEPVLMRDFVAEAARDLGRKIPRFSIPPILPETVFRFNKNFFKIKKIERISDTFEKWLSDDVYSAEKIKQKYNFETKTPILKGLKKQIERYRKITKTVEND